MAQNLTFVIRPDDVSLSFGLFRKTIEDIEHFLKSVTYAATQQQGVRQWIIAELQSKDVAVTLEHILGDGIAQHVVQGLRTIAIGTVEPPLYFSQFALDDLKGMSRLFKGRDRVRQLEFCSDGAQPAIIRAGIDKQVDRIFRGGFWNLGSIEGTLEALNLHGNRTFTIWDRVSRSPVKCNFPTDPTWKDRVISLLEKRVLVVGRVAYFANGVPRSITNIANIEEVSPSSGLPKASYGSIPSPGIAKDPAGFLRAVRGERG